MTNIAMVLDRLGKTLVAEVVPKLKGDYSAGHVTMAGLMNVMAGEAWDGAADRLFTEIGEMRVLLAEGGVVLEVADAPSLKVSDLTTERDGLARKLIELQAGLEVHEDQAAQDLNTRIWLLLMQTAVARMPSPPAIPEAQ